MLRAIRLGFGVPHVDPAPLPGRGPCVGEDGEGEGAEGEEGGGAHDETGGGKELRGGKVI